MSLWWKFWDYYTNTIFCSDHRNSCVVRRLRQLKQFQQVSVIGTWSCRISIPVLTTATRMPCPIADTLTRDCAVLVITRTCSPSVPMSFGAYQIQYYFLVPAGRSVAGLALKSRQETLGLFQYPIEYLIVRSRKVWIHTQALVFKCSFRFERRPAYQRF